MILTWAWLWLLQLVDKCWKTVNEAELRRSSLAVIEGDEAEQGEEQQQTQETATETETAAEAINE